MVMWIKYNDTKFIYTMTQVFITIHILLHNPYRLWLQHTINFNLMSTGIVHYTKKVEVLDEQNILTS